MAIISGRSGKLYIGTKAVADDATSFASDTYTQVKGIDSLPEIGDSATIVTFDDLSEGRVLKSKGTRNAGTTTVSMAYIDADPGQEAMIDAEADDASDSSYNFKVEYSDGAIRYFKAIVAEMREGGTGANDTLLINATLDINSAVVRVAPV